MTLTLPDQPIPDERLTNGKVAEILLTAAAVIEREGLHLGDWWEFGPRDAPLRMDWAPGQRCCAIGAIGVASGYRDVYGVAREVAGGFEDDDAVQADGPHPALRALMTWLGVDRPSGVWRWSDDAHTDGEAERVTETLRAVAAGLLARGEAR